MTPVKILVVLFTLANAGQFALMAGGIGETSRLIRILQKFHIDFFPYPGFTLSIIVFVVLIFALFSFFRHFINYKEHYSAFFRFLILANFFASILAVIFNFYLYFIKG